MLVPAPLQSLVTLLPSVGRLGILLTLVVACYGALAALVGHYRRRPALVASGRNALYACAALLTLSSVALLYALYAHDFSVRYVAQQTTRDMPWYIRLAAFYASQEGSLLFWGWSLALWSALAVALIAPRHPALAPHVTATLAGVQAFFAYLVVALADPFARLWPAPADGRGLNPLLYDSGMLVHPPLQLMGYMASVVPFAIVVAALATGRLDGEWVAAVRRWMLAAWALLGSGLMLGAWWAYHTLGWGGYWGWDPVENVGLLPWITMTAYLHSAMIQERRGMLKLWNVSLVLASFALSIFGTLVVRSGILSSVHSFAQSAIGPAFFAFLAGIVVLSVLLLLLRLPRLRDDGAIEALLSREAAFLVNNLILAGIALATLWGTIYPLVSEAVRGAKVAVGPSFYKQVNGPLLFALLVLLAVATALPWRSASGPRLLRALAVPLGTALVASLLTFTLGARSLTAQLGIAACVLAGAVTLLEFARGAAVRHRNAREALPLALLRLVSRGRRRYGGYLVHVGIVLMGLGVVGSTWFQVGHEAQLAPGEQMQLGQYAFTYRGRSEFQEAGARVVQATVEVADGDQRFFLYPGKRFHRGWEQQPGTLVSIQTVFPRLDDLYVVFAGWEDDKAHIQAFVNPLVWLLWVGLGLVWLASGILLWPERRRVVAGQRVLEPSRARLRLDAAVGALRALGRPTGLPVAGGAVALVVVGALALGQIGTAQPGAAVTDGVVASPAALFDQGEAYMQNGQWQQAIETFNRVLRLEPAVVPPGIDLIHAQTDVAIAHMNLGQLAQAEPIFKDLVRKQPANQQIHYSLGFLYATSPQPDYAAARSHWQEAIQLQPDSQWGSAAMQSLAELRAREATP
jgi:cytochrome c-type biogenesis protein CcmF